MNHDFAVVQIGERMWRHVCQVPGCGASFDKPAPLYHRRCPVLAMRAQAGLRGWWARRAIARPGDLLRLLIHFATSGTVAHGLACEHFRMRMNAWGWRGCWRERWAIYQRIKSQAAKEGYASNPVALAARASLGLARWSIFVVRKWPAIALRLQ